LRIDGLPQALAVQAHGTVLARQFQARHAGSLRHGRLIEVKRAATIYFSNCFL
jgi:hypothetical protein